MEAAISTRVEVRDWETDAVVAELTAGTAYGGDERYRAYDATTVRRRSWWPWVIAAGAIADLVVLDATSPAQAITEQVEKLWVLKAGRVVARNSRTSEVLAFQE